MAGWIALHSKGLAGLGVQVILPYAYGGEQGIYVGTWNGGYESFNDGVFWKPEGSDEWLNKINETPSSSMMINALVKDKEGAVYAGAWDGILRSIDGGDSWSLSMPNLSVNALAIDQTGRLYAGGVLYAEGGAGVVYKSIDRGLSWIRAVSFPSDKGAVDALVVDSTGAVYANCHEGTYKSVDLGNSWTLLQGESQYDLNGGLASAVDKNDTVYVGGYNGVSKTTDGGRSWNEVMPTSSATGWVTSLVSPEPGIVYAGTFYGGVYKSSDGGAQWISLNEGLAGSYPLSLATDARGTVFVGTGSSGVFKIDVYDDAKKINVIEFYHQKLDHYFMSANLAEISDLDAGKHAGWERTGHHFQAYDRPIAGAKPVCRFYMRPEAGDSHFYSASKQECLETAERFSKDWILESEEVFYSQLPDMATGVCPEDSQPVWRFFHEAKTNHRYTAETSLRDHLRTMPGWIAEGYGLDAVIMCAPQ